MSQQNPTNNGGGPPAPEKKRKAKQKAPVPMVQHVRVQVPVSVYALLLQRCRQLGTPPEDLASFLLESGQLLKSAEVRFGTVAPAGSIPVPADELEEAEFRSMDVPISRQLHSNLHKWSAGCGWTREGVAGEMLNRLAGNDDVTGAIRSAAMVAYLDVQEERGYYY
jgi:hypothetical protein